MRAYKTSPTLAAPSDWAASLSKGVAAAGAGSLAGIQGFNVRCITKNNGVTKNQ